MYYYYYFKIFKRFYLLSKVPDIIEHYYATIIMVCCYYILYFNTAGVLYWPIRIRVHNYLIYYTVYIRTVIGCNPQTRCSHMVAKALDLRWKLSFSPTHTLTHATLAYRLFSSWMHNILNEIMFLVGMVVAWNGYALNLNVAQIPQLVWWQGVNEYVCVIWGRA